MTTATKPHKPTAAERLNDHITNLVDACPGAVVAALLKDKTRIAVASHIAVLGMDKPEVAEPALTLLLDDPSQYVRYAAQKGLDRIEANRRKAAE
jgi:HEAT repeat protein